MTEIATLHVINLDTVGGVEELFAHFLKGTSSPHHLLVTGGKIHPHFQAQITQHAASITYEKYLCGMKIPKWLSPLRSLQRKRAVRNVCFDRVVLWNRIESITDLKKELSSCCKVIYYEHGASWIERASNRITDFFSSVDLIFANSLAAKRLLELKWNICTPITVIPNPLRPDLLLAKKGRVGFHTPFCIGYIGRLIPLKGVSLLLHAVKLAAQKNIPIQLIIAGDGEEKERLQKEALSLGISPLVEFRGIVNDVGSFYDTIDLLVVPSIREPLGLVALEANARGCPVIASCVDGLPEAVSDGTSGFLLNTTLPLSRYAEFGGRCEKLPDCIFDPKSNALQTPALVDPAAIAERIEYLFTHPEEYAILSQRAIDHAHRRPDFSEYTKNLSELICCG